MVDAEFIFVDKQEEKDEFLGNKKQKVAELPDAPETKDDDGEVGEDGESKSDGEGGDETFEGIEEMDIFIAKMLLSLIDDTRATWLSTYAYKDIDHSEKYRYYKDLDSKQHKPLVTAMAYIVRKYRLSKSPEVIVAIALAASTYFLYQQARSDRKEREEKEREEKERKQQQKQQQAQEQHHQGNQGAGGAGGGKIIKMPQKQNKFHAI